MIKNITAFFVVLSLFSCSTEPVSKPEKEQLVIQQSSSLRVSLEGIKKLEQSEKSAVTTQKGSESELCFQFVYPITLSYNTDTTVEVTGYEQLLGLVLSETLDEHITGIGFPFDIEIRASGDTQTITNESEFSAVVKNCNYDSIEYERVVNFASACFSVNYPLELLINNSEENFTSEEQAQEYFLSNYTSIKSLQINYPLEVTLIENSEILVVNDDFEFIYLINETCGIN